MRYRRTRQPGGTYFFTVNLAERSGSLLTERIDDLRNIVRAVKRHHPFDIVAWIVLPDHMHAIWTLPEGDGDNARRWTLIKAGFSRSVPQGEQIRPSRLARGERGIWQRRFWEHLVTDEDDLRRHIDYIHFNPVTRPGRRIGRTVRFIDTFGVDQCRKIGRRRQMREALTKATVNIGWGECNEPQH